MIATHEERASHTQDSDCAGSVVDGECAVCGVGHGGDPCETCGGRAYHVEYCPTAEGERLSDHALAQFPKRCTACEHVFETARQFMRETVAPRTGSFGSGLWFRSHRCGGGEGEYTLAIELNEEKA